MTNAARELVQQLNMLSVGFRERDDDDELRHFWQSKSKNLKKI